MDKISVCISQFVSTKAQILSHTMPYQSYEYGPGSGPGYLFSWIFPVSLPGLHSQLIPKEAKPVEQAEACARMKVVDRNFLALALA